jgi:hypothetical protein
MSFPLTPFNGQNTVQNGIEYTYSSATNSWRRNYNNVLTTLFVGGGPLVNSTSPETGQLRVTGGVGIGGNLNVGGNATVNGTITAKGTVYLNPLGGSVYIEPTLGGTVVIFPNQTGHIDNMIIGASVPNIGKFTSIAVLDTTNSTSPQSGALTVAGGVGISKDLHVGGKIYADQLIVNSSSSTWYYTNTNYAAVAGDRIFVDTALNTLTITLPVNPSVGDTIEFLDYKGSFGSNTMTFNGNGQNIMGLAEPLIVDIPNAGNYLIYSGITQGWKIGVVF